MGRTDCVPTTGLLWHSKIGKTLVVKKELLHNGYCERATNNIILTLKCCNIFATEKTFELHYRYPYLIIRVVIYTCSIEKAKIAAGRSHQIAPTFATTLKFLQAKKVDAWQVCANMLKFTFCRLLQTLKKIFQKKFSQTSFFHSEWQLWKEDFHYYHYLLISNLSLETIVFGVSKMDTTSYKFNKVNLIWKINTGLITSSEF